MSGPLLLTDLVTNRRYLPHQISLCRFRTSELEERGRGILVTLSHGVAHGLCG